MSDGDDAKPEEAEDAGEETTEESEEGSEGEAAPAGLKGKLAGKMKFIIIGVVALVLIGGGAGAYFAGVFDSDNPLEAEVELPGLPVFYEMPKMTVDLKPSERRVRPLILVTMQIELQGEAAKAAFINNEVRILDSMQTHLRTITVEELEGHDGTQRLREDFRLIINRIIAPERCIAVLYKDILIR